MSTTTITSQRRPDKGATVSSSAYWESRAQQFATHGAGLAAVCSYGMPDFYNRYIDVVQRRALDPWLRSSGGMRVLDVGCGVGRWSRRLAQAGADVTGVDLSETMILEARRRTSATVKCRFVVADITDLTLATKFDRIVGVTVLQHLRETSRLEAALGRLAAHLEPDGQLVLLEVAPSTPSPRCDTGMFIAREQSRYQQAFSRAGLHCVDVRGVDPAPFKTWLLPSYRKMAPLTAAATLALVTAVSLPVDVLLARRFAHNSWHKIFVLAHESRRAA